MRSLSLAPPSAHTQVFPCYAVAAGSTIADSVSTVKVIAVVTADGAVNTATTTVYPYYGRNGYQVALRNAVTADGSTFFIAGSPGSCGYNFFGTCYSQGGFMRLPGFAATTTANKVSITQNLPGYLDARPLLIYKQQLYAVGSSLDTAAAEGLWTMGAGLPATTILPVQVPGTGGILANPWCFVFGDDNSVYIVSDGDGRRRVRGSGALWGPARCRDTDASPPHHPPPPSRAGHDRQQRGAQRAAAREQQRSCWAVERGRLDLSVPRPARVLHHRPR